jgi:hypothetical protein
MPSSLSEGGNAEETKEVMQITRWFSHPMYSGLPASWQDLRRNKSSCFRRSSSENGRRKPCRNDGTILKALTIDPMFA